MAKPVESQLYPAGHEIHRAEPAGAYVPPAQAEGALLGDAQDDPAGQIKQVATPPVE